MLILRSKAKITFQPNRSLGRRLMHQIIQIAAAATILSVATTGDSIASCTSNTANCEARCSLLPNPRSLNQCMAGCARHVQNCVQTGEGGNVGQENKFKKTERSPAPSHERDTGKQVPTVRELSGANQPNRNLEEDANGAERSKIDDVGSRSRPGLQVGSGNLGPPPGEKQRGKGPDFTPR
jgi:hypothetical protein